MNDEDSKPESPYGKIVSVEIYPEPSPVLWCLTDEIDGMIVEFNYEGPISGKRIEMRLDMVRKREDAVRIHGYCFELKDRRTVLVERMFSITDSRSNQEYAHGDEWIASLTSAKEGEAGI